MEFYKEPIPDVNLTKQTYVPYSQSDGFSGQEGVSAVWRRHRAKAFHDALRIQLAVHFLPLTLLAEAGEAVSDFRQESDCLLAANQQET